MSSQKKEEKRREKQGNRSLSQETFIPLADVVQTYPLEGTEVFKPSFWGGSPHMHLPSRTLSDQTPAQNLAGNGFGFVFFAVRPPGKHIWGSISGEASPGKHLRGSISGEASPGRPPGKHLWGSLRVDPPMVFLFPFWGPLEGKAKGGASWNKTPHMELWLKKPKGIPTWVARSVSGNMGTKTCSLTPLFHFEPLPYVQIVVTSTLNMQNGRNPTFGGIKLARAIPLFESSNSSMESLPSVAPLL